MSVVSGRLDVRSVIVFGEEVQHLLAVGVEIGMLEQCLAVARARQIDLEHLADRGARPVGHHHHAVGQQDRLVDVVRDHDRGDFRAVPHFDQHVLQVPARQAVEHAERLVEQQQPRTEREGAGDADALAHAVRHLGRELVPGIAEADAFEIVVDDLAPLAAGGVRVDALDPERDVLARGEPGHQARRLEHHRLVRPGDVDLAVVEHDRALADRVEPGRHRQHGGLAASRMADQRDELALVHQEVEVLDYGQ
ncbi:hypothetical protein BVRB_022690, partial [Beta vulgaris subsp. vulgaris]